MAARQTKKTYRKGLETAAGKARKKKAAPSKKRAAASAPGSHKRRAGSASDAKGKKSRASISAKTGPEPSKKTSARKGTSKVKPAKAKVPTKLRAKVNAKGPAKTVDASKELRRSLLRRREAIVREAKEEIAKYISGENRQLVDTALDEGDWAVVDISEDISLRRLAVHRKALHDIDEALRKLEEGSYGICEECGGEIGEKRLSVLPSATLCVICQGTKERLEAIEKEETSV